MDTPTTPRPSGRTRAGKQINFTLDATDLERLRTQAQSWLEPGTTTPCTEADSRVAKRLVLLALQTLEGVHV